MLYLYLQAVQYRTVQTPHLQVTITGSILDLPSRLITAVFPLPPCALFSLHSLTLRLCSGRSQGQSEHKLKSGSKSRDIMDPVSLAGLALGVASISLQVYTGCIQGTSVIFSPFNHTQR